MAIRLPNVSCTHGAPMGRRSYQPSEVLERVRLERVAMAGHGEYDTGGAYWGIGDPLYLARTVDQEDELFWFLRAKSRDDAKSQVREEYPDAKFFS